MITAEQAEQAKGIVLETLDVHHQGSLPFRQVWTKPSEDFDGAPFLKVWVVYDGEPSDLDIPMLNSYDLYLLEDSARCRHQRYPVRFLYFAQIDREKLGTSWTG